jgi:hypothetical protein
MDGPQPEETSMNEIKLSVDEVMHLLAFLRKQRIADFDSDEEAVELYRIYNKLKEEYRNV